MTDSIDHFVDEWRRERPDIESWPAAIWPRLYRISSLLQRRSERVLAPLGLSWEAFSVVVTLRRSGPPYELRPRDILRESLLTSGAVTNRIDRVEALELVERRSSGADRRGVTVRLTDKGLRLADEAIAAHFAMLAQLFGVFARQERDQFAALLAKLLRALEEQPDKKGETARRAPGADLPA